MPSVSGAPCIGGDHTVLGLGLGIHTRPSARAGGGDVQDKLDRHGLDVVGFVLPSTSAPASSSWFN